MNGEGLISAQSAQNFISGGPAREKAQTIVESMVSLHSRELAGWQWLKIAMEAVPPNVGEEAALWEIVCRARRERY